MHLSIDRERCQGHGRCVMVNPALFDLDDDGYGFVLKAQPEAELLGDVNRAVGDCPERAIQYG